MSTTTASVKNRTFYTVVLLNLVMFIIFMSTLKQLLSFWSESYAYSHGILLFPLVFGLYFYLILKKPKLNIVSLNVYNTLGFLGLTFIWFITNILNIQFIEFFSFFLILLLFNFTLTSRNIKDVNHLWPLVLIVFTLPVWDFMPEILRILETPIVVLILNATFIEAVQDGFLIYIPAGTFLVETSCSGFNQFLVSIPLAALYLYSRNLTLRKGYKIILSLLGLAVVFNIIRIYIILVAGQLTHMKSSLIVDSHEYLAWLIYGIGVFIFFYYLDKKHPHSPSTEIEDEASSFKLKSVQLTKSLYLIFVIIVSGPILSLILSANNQQKLLDSGSLESSLFWKEYSHSAPFKPAFSEGDIVYNNRLSNLFGQSVNLYINYFISQSQGREAISSMNRLVDNKLGSIEKQRTSSIRYFNNKELSVNESIVALKTGELYLSWQWYYVNSKHVNKSGDARLNNLLGIVSSKPQMASIVVSKKIDSNENNTRQVMELFLKENFVGLAEYLDSV